MKKRWKAPNHMTQVSKQVWRVTCPLEPWPNGWRVEWAGFMRGVAGLTVYGRRLILLNYADARRDRCPVETLLHEFVHMRHGHQLRHGQEFTRLENGLRERVGFEVK